MESLVIPPSKTPDQPGGRISSNRVARPPDRRWCHSSNGRHHRARAVAGGAGGAKPVGTEIHDTLAQGLSAISWQLNAAERAVAGGGAPALEYLERVRNLVRGSFQEARRSVWDLRLGPLEGRTLTEALRGETERVAGAASIPVSFAVSGPERVLPAGVEAALLLICQESLANMLKHANATQATVTLVFDDSQVRLAVQDNGIGFDPEILPKRGLDSGGFGLINMRARARLLGES